MTPPLHLKGNASIWCQVDICSDALVTPSALPQPVLLTPAFTLLSIHDLCTLEPLDDTSYTILHACKLCVRPWKYFTTSPFLNATTPSICNPNMNMNMHIYLSSFSLPTSHNFTPNPTARPRSGKMLPWPAPRTMHLVPGPGPPGLCNRHWWLGTYSGRHNHSSGPSGGLEYRQGYLLV